MVKLKVIIETSGDNYSAYIDGLDGIIATGKSIEEIKSNMAEAISMFKEGCEECGCDIPEELRGEYETDFIMDAKSLLDMYSSIFTKAGLEKITGINQKQLWHYASGKTKPRESQKKKIENAIHKLGQELISIRI